MQRLHRLQLLDKGMDSIVEAEYILLRQNTLEGGEGGQVRDVPQLSLTYVRSHSMAVVHVFAESVKIPSFLNDAMKALDSM